MAQTFHRYRAGDKPVGGYKLIRKLGEGGFGEVWQASAPGGAEVALKFIDLTGQQGFREFKALRLVKKITHINLIPLHGFWLKNEDGTLIDESDVTWSQLAPSIPVDPAAAPSASLATAIFTQPVELIIAMGLGRKSLYDRLKECRDEGREGIPPEELLDYMEDAAKGIDYLNRPIHNLGHGSVPIIHSDIKPHNILIVGDGAAVCDFGLAHAVETLRKTCQAPLTLAYAAPESFRGKPGDKSDQYSFAITYIELRTGTLPFDEGMTGYEVMTAHVQGALDLVRLTPAEAKVIRRATAVMPQDRWRSSREMVMELRKALRLTSDSNYMVEAEAPGPPSADAARTPNRAYTMMPPGSPSSETSPFSGPTPSDVDPALRTRTPASVAPVVVPATIPVPQPETTRDISSDLWTMPKAVPREWRTARHPPMPASAKLHDNVQFTLYRPKVVRPMQWHTLLAFAHLSERPTDAPNNEPNPIEEVKRLAARALEGQMGEYCPTTQDSMDAVPHAGELLVIPEMDGMEFNPTRHTFRLIEMVHQL